MSVVTRFAPSPTGYLHIGGARTALFSWLYARHCGGKFLLRIEDTDRARSVPAAIDAILDGLKWLELDHDGEVVYQFSRAERHAAVAQQLLATGKAYHCYCSPQELEEMRALAKAEGRPIKYDGRWRDRSPNDAPAGVAPVIRLKAPQVGETIIKDQVQGDVVFDNAQLDDMILLRADGTPTYMLSVVVDDFDMGITHIIRGDDHLNNAARQLQLIRAMNWPEPNYAHIPLIHGPDGAKLSKRHGALGIEAYRDLGYLPAAMRNYLLRLGWSHGDEEIISTEQAVQWFDLEAIGRSPSRIDFAKLDSVNSHYLREATLEQVIDLLKPFLAKKLGRPLNDAELIPLTGLLPALRERTKNLVELADASLFLFLPRPLVLSDKALGLVQEDGALIHLDAIIGQFSALGDWNAMALETATKNYAENAGIKLGKIAQPIRASLTGSNVSPGIYDVLVALGREESLQRLGDGLLQAKK